MTLVQSACRIMLLTTFLVMVQSEDPSLINRLFHKAFLRFSRRDGLSKIVNSLISEDFLHLGYGNKTNGNAFALNVKHPRECIQPDYLLVCSLIKNQAWVLNEWLVHHLWVSGVNHVVLYDDNSTDNFMEVVKPWVEAGMVTVHGVDDAWRHIRQTGAYKTCYVNYGKQYKWATFLDIDEFLYPVQTPCLPTALKPYEAYGGLSVGWSFARGAKVHARRDRETVYEVTNFTMGSPHPLVKPVCFVNHTYQPTHNMPHCCDYFTGFYNVDENFQHFPHSGQTPCWQLHNGTGSQPRKVIQIMHYSHVSFEEAMQRALTRQSNNGSAFGDGKDKFDFIPMLRDFEAASSHVMHGSVMPTADQYARMQAFRTVLNSVLIGRQYMDASENNLV